MDLELSKVIRQPSLVLAWYKEATGQALGLWATVAGFSLLTMIVLRQDMLPGEFGTLNTALGAIGLMTVPLMTLRLAYLWHFSHAHGPGDEQRIDTLRAASPIVTETFAWSWAVAVTVLLLVGLSMLELPRFSIHLFIILNVLMAIGTLLGGYMCEEAGQFRLWAWLVICAALARLILSLIVPYAQPWAESGLAVFLIAGLITFAPALRQSEVGESQRLNALKTVWDRKFLIDLGAMFSVVLAIYLFTNADRIVAQAWFGSPADNNIGYVNWPMFDAYQTAGLLARSLLWGTQPVLLLFFLRRLKLNKSTAASLDWFWIYLGALVTGITLLNVFNESLSWLFCGRDYVRTAKLVPVLAVTMFPLGLLQGLGVFALASRRYPECFIMGGCGIGYMTLLYCVGRHPALMPAFMFGGALVSLMLVLFVGVVRWGRKQP